jgi:SAM-dependent methyltransferase
LFYRDQTTLFTENARLLHMAPELCLERQFRSIPTIQYLSGDLDPSRAMVQMDLTNLDLPDSSFDFVHVSHVLEHIPDDVAAMRELRRILRPGGTAVLAVPMWGDETLEDLSITDPDERQRRYGQPDHVRLYGRDGTFEERLRTVGFDVVSDPVIREMDPARRRRFRVRGREPIFRCT